MKKDLLKGLFLIALACSLSAQECPPIKTNQRDLTLQPDTASDELMQAFGYSLANKNQTNRLEKQLLSQAAPILVELTIWKRFAKEKFDTKQTAIEKLPYRFYQIDNFMLCIPEKWRTKYPDTGFNLANATLLEKPFLLLPSRLDLLKGLGKTTLMLANLYGSIVATLKKLLVHDTSNNYSWNILLFGHGGPMMGSYTDRVAGLPSTEFKKLLQFMNTNINTNIFLYQTCYAASKWLLRFYETNNQPDSYNYPIILTGISEAPVYSWMGHSPAIYQNFFDKIRTISICPEKSHELFMTAAALLQAIKIDSSVKKISLSGINNIIQIRWAGSKKFKIVEIDSIVTTAKTAKKSSSDTVTISSPAFVLNTPYLDKTVQLSAGQHSIASSIAQKEHFIKEILVTEQLNSSDAISKKLFNFFLQVTNLSSLKLYMIDTVSDGAKKQTITNVMIFINSATPSTYPLMKTTEMFYLHNNNGYLLDAKKQTIKQLAPPMKDNYLKQFNKEKYTLKAVQQR